MKKVINYILFPILPIVSVVLLGVLFALAVLTPDKTSSGQYPDPVAYWLDDCYFESEFNK